MVPGLVDIPGIVGGIGRHVQRKVPQPRHQLDEQGQVIADIALVEGVGELGQDDIAIVGRGGGSDAGAVAPLIFFALLCGAIGVFLVGAAFDADATVRVATGLTLFTEAIGD